MSEHRFALDPNAAPPAAIGLSDPFTIARVEPGSLGERLGLLPRERILEINGVALHDEIDFGAQISEEHLRLRVLTPDGSTREVEGFREYGVPFGVEFEARQPKRCHNNCVFCFVYQHPKGVRRELLIKDDDYVFSFVHGNFITLTNLGEAEFQRILDERLSPLYVSVHATDPDVRVRMMKNPKSGRILADIDRLAAGGIDLHTQLVIVPGMNDGEVLARSIEELAARFPRVQTIAVVPVGLTKHRGRLPELRTFTREDAVKALEQVHGFQAAFRKRHRTRIVFAADEMYVLAGEEVPPARAYEGFPQLENGIGMLRQTIDSWTPGCIRPRAGARRNGAPERVAIVTGTSAAPTLRRLLVEQPPRDLDVSLCVVTNEYFGDTVSVSGLLVGADIEAALLRHGPVDRVLLPPNCLKEREIFLDDRTRTSLEQAVGAPVEIGFDETPAA